MGQTVLSRPSGLLLTGLLLVLAQLVSCAGGEKPEVTPLVLILEHERLEWEGNPLPTAAVGQSFRAEELAGWTSEADLEVSEGALSWSGPALLESPGNLVLDAGLLDRVEVTVDTGNDLGTAFDLSWPGPGGEERRLPVRTQGTGRQQLSLDLLLRERWRGPIESLSFGPISQPAEARTRLEEISFSGPYADLAERVAGPGEVSHAGEFRQALRAATPATGRLELRCPPGARLHLGLGCTGGPGDEYRMGVAAVLDDGTRMELLAERMTGERGWVDATVSLEELAGQRIVLELVAEGPAGAVALFSEPILRTAGDPQQPGVFLYLTDTLRRDALSLHGAEKSASPRLQRFASDAVVFDRALAQSNWTEPSVVSLMTSTRLGTHGVPHRGKLLGPEHETLAQLLRRAGYRTASFTTNTLTAHASGLERGFSTVVDTRRRADLDETRTLPPRALEWIEQHAEEPMFVYLHTAEPHDPYEPPAEHAPRGGEELEVDGRNFVRLARSSEEVDWVRSLYAGEVRHADSSFGEFLDHLAGLELLDPSWVIFTSDHGEAFLEHGRWRHRAGMYGHQLEVPLLVHRPGGVEGGTWRDELVGLIDVLPTLLAGLDLPDPGGLEGSPLFGDSRKQNTRAPAIPGIAGVLSESSRAPGAGPEHLQWAFTTPRWKVILDTDFVREREKIEVFDLQQDPAEQEPLAEPWPEEVLRIVESLRAWRQDHRGGRSSGEGPVDLGYVQELEALGYAGEDD